MNKLPREHLKLRLIYTFYFLLLDFEVGKMWATVEPSIYSPPVLLLYGNLNPNLSKNTEKTAFPKLWLSLDWM